jgi:pyruvate kinase
MRKAKIVATIGPASESVEQLRELIKAGLDVTRVNMSHGERQHHGEVIQRIRQVSGELKKPVGIMIDLSGPKIRTGNMQGGSINLEEGAEVHITTEDIEGTATRFSANYPLLAREVKANDRILLNDGEIELEVISTTDSEVAAKVIHGGALGNHKGINLPGAQISIPSITEKDVADLRFGLEAGADIVAQSFVRSANDCKRARELMRQFNGNARLIAKIEKPEAVDDLANILDVADGVMVARGDLAVETSTERVPVLQKTIIAAALKAERTIITATQMLQSMIESPRPTRAEASDVSNAVLDGSDAVMLSGETAVGRFPVQAVKIMDKIIRATEEMSAPSQTALRETMFGRHSGSYGRAVSEAAVFAAEEAGCRFIVVLTQTGHMARRIAALRPRQRIISLTPVEKSYNQLAMTWGIEPFLLTDCTIDSKELLSSADKALLNYQLAERGEIVVVMAGRLEDVSLSLSMKLHRVGDFSPQSK